jgi:hypothetical protein
MEQAEARASRQDLWVRGAIMLLFAVSLWLGQWLTNLIALLQFLWLVFTDEPNRVLAEFGKSLAKWLAEVARFQTCATEQRPFPFTEWPKAD